VSEPQKQIFINSYSHLKSLIAVAVETM